MDIISEMNDDFELYNKAYDIIREAVDNGDTAGVNMLVIKDGYEKCYCEYGMRDIENSLPIKRDTIFRLYSQTKPVTAAAVMLLVSRGKVDLSADIADYLTEFSEQYVNTDGSRKPVSRRITVRDLMNMTSGLAYPDDRFVGGKQSGEMFWKMEQRLYTDNPVTTFEFAQMASKLDLCFEPGSQFLYGISADVLGALVERVSGVTFGEFLRTEFFEPLEMFDTDFYVPEEKQHRLSTEYHYGEKRRQEYVTYHLSLRYRRDVPAAFESGGAGLCSTLDDYSHFASMLMNGGVYNGTRVLPEAAVKQLTTTCFPPELKPQLNSGWDWLSGYSYGNLMRICTDESQTSVFSAKGEYGWDGWLGTFFSNEPKHGITLLVGLQQVGIGRAGTLVRKLKNLTMSELV